MSKNNLIKALKLPAGSKYLTELEDLIKEQILSSDNNLLTAPALRLVGGGGKNLRGGLVITIAINKGGVVKEKPLYAAAAVELLHLASLVHDDIMDEAALRRGVKTVNSSEGNSQALLVGDYLLSRAYSCAAKVNAETVNILAETFSKMCDGQSSETYNRHNLRRTAGEYFDTIGKKSAELVAASCEIGALTAGYSAPQVKKLTSYGLNLGISYQLADDLLDFTGKPGSMGKPTGVDVSQGVYTLPIIKLVDQLGEEEVSRLMKSSFKQLLTTLKNQDILMQVMAEINEYKLKAEASLALLDGSVIEDLGVLPGQLLASVGLDANE